MTFKESLQESFNTGTLQIFIKESKFLKDVCVKLGYSDHARNTKYLREFCNTNSISLDGYSLRVKAVIEVRICPVCNTEFNISVNNKKKSKQVTCSHACANTYFRSGSNANNYKGLEVSRYDIKAARYGLTECCVCKEAEVIDIHHIDEDRNNNSIENLLPLCPTHHAYVHRGKLDLIIDKIEKYLALVV